MVSTYFAASEVLAAAPVALYLRVTAELVLFTILGSEKLGVVLVVERATDAGVASPLPFALQPLSEQLKTSEKTSTGLI